MEHSELLLLAIFGGLYLYDSALLLYANEAVLIPRRRGGWIVGFGSNRTTLKGRELYVPNPFFPNRPQYRLTWKYGGSSDLIAPSWEQSQPPLKVFASLVFGLFISSFCLLPIAMFGKGGDFLILMTFFLIYAHVILIVILLWLKREQIGLTNKEFFAIAFDFFICPPFALNVVRRLSLRLSVKEDLVSAAKRFQSQSNWKLTKTELISRIDEELGGEDKASELFTLMQAKRSELASEEKHDKT
jgi:hypothetical protein